jgi:adenosine deaminase
MQVQLAQSLSQGGTVVGIDLSGNPAVGSWGTWEAALAAARDSGLKVTLHGGEINNDDEVEAMLRFRPDRLGHMCCMGPKCEAHLLVGVDCDGMCNMELLSARAAGCANERNRLQGGPADLWPHIL